MVVYFSLGTNLGDKEQNLRMAVQKIRKQIGEVISLSAFYATAPWGFSSDNTFLNAALCVGTGKQAVHLPSGTGYRQPLRYRRDPYG